MAVQTKDLMEDTEVYLHDCQITKIFTTERGIAFRLRDVQMKDSNGLYEGDTVVLAEGAGPKKLLCVKKRKSRRMFRHIRNFFNTSFVAVRFCNWEELTGYCRAPYRMEWADDFYTYGKMLLRLLVSNLENNKYFELWVDIPCQKVHCIRGSEWIEYLRRRKPVARPTEEKRGPVPNILKTMRETNLKITWKLLYIGFCGNEYIPKQLRRSEIEEYMYTWLDEADAPVDQIISLIVEENDEPKWQRRLQQLSENENSEEMLQNRKWRVCILQELIERPSRQEEECLPSILDVLEFWAALDWHEKWPFNVPRFDESSNFYSWEGYEALRECNRLWVQKEIQAIQAKEMRQGN